MHIESFNFKLELKSVILKPIMQQPGGMHVIICGGFQGCILSQPYSVIGMSIKRTLALRVFSANLAQTGILHPTNFDTRIFIPLI